MTILPLALEEVTVSAGGKPLLGPISLKVEAGARTVILGPNGAGKSLLLRLCHGLIGPSAGRVRWLGTDTDRAYRRQAMVFQHPVMLRRSVRANIAYGLKIHGVARPARRARIDAALAATGLGALAERPAPVLSAGEQQRLALARVWALEPEVLFLDEPTASLDPSATAAVERIVDALHAKGCKIVTTTHDMNQARRLADEVIFLHGGRMVEHAAAADFFDRPRSDVAAAFLEGRLLW
jgi:tungstate transport system ATP-binding protein